MRLFLFLLCSLAAHSRWAQTQPLTVEEAVLQAIKNNPRLSAAVREVVAARLSVRSARAIVNPDFALIPSITKGGSDEELLFLQPFELNGSRVARIRVAQARLRVTEAETLAELRNLVFETRVAYYELVRAQELRALTQDLLKVAEEFERITRRQVEVGTRPGIDLTQIEIEVTRARQQVALAEGQFTAALAALNTLMGRSSQEPVGTLPLPFVKPEPVDKEEVLQQAFTTRAEILAAGALRETLLQEIRLTRATGLPDLGFQVRVENLTRNPRTSGFGIALTLPLLDYGARRDRIRELEEAARAQTDRVAATRNQVRQEVEAVFARLQAAEKVLQEYEQGLLDKAKRLLDASRIGFQAGQISLIAVLEAQSTYRSVQTEYVNAQVNYAQACAELERATGTVPANWLANVHFTGGVQNEPKP